MYMGIKNKLLLKLQKGGAGIDDETITMLIKNVFLVCVHVAIFTCLFIYKNLFNVVFYLFIVLIIVSFFTCMYLLFGQYNPMGKYLISMFTNTDLQIEWTSNDSMKYAVAFILFSVGILQFVSTTLIVTVFNVRRPPKNTFSLTVQNAKNLFNYEVLYILTFIASIIYYVMLAFLTNIEKDSTLLYFATSTFSIIIIGLVSYMFYYAYQIYYNVIIKKNQLYQGNNNGNNTIGPTGKPKIPTKVPPTPTLPQCTQPVNTGQNPTAQEQCY